MEEMTKETEIVFYGEKLTIEQFNAKYFNGEGSIEDTIGAVEILIKKGKAILAETQNKTPQQEMFEQVNAEEAIKNLADMADLEEENQKDFKAQKKRIGQLVHKRVEIDFENYTKALEALNFCREKVRMKNVTIESDGGAVNVLVLQNVTENELSMIKRYYTAGKISGAVVGAVTKAQEELTDGIDFATKNVLAPVAKITARSSMSVARSLFALGARTTANVITATTQGVAKTREELVTDPDIIRATREIIGVKDALSRKLNTNKIGGKGIRIVQ